MKSFILSLQLSLSGLSSLLYMLPITIVMIFVAESCVTTKKNTSERQRVEMMSDKDSTEYSLIVLDPSYESYLATQPSVDFYSQQYYENWNNQYVMEWNMRHLNPLRYGSFYETHIDYDSNEDYGLDLNYRLYNYFLFIKDRYGIVLINRRR